MSCRHCTSDNQSEFRAEMSVVHRQLKDLGETACIDVDRCSGLCRLRLHGVHPRRRNCDSSLALMMFPKQLSQVTIEGRIVSHPLHGFQSHSSKVGTAMRWGVYGAEKATHPGRR